MKHRLLPLIGLLTGLAIFNNAQAADGPALIEQARCYMCHLQDSASLGPPWQAIATRHASRRNEMREVLARKIVYGGGGNWGVVPMVPNQQISLDQARVIAEWILDQASK